MATLPSTVLLISILATTVTSDQTYILNPCTCGYSVNSTSDPEYAVFTEALETDFLHIYNVTDNLCWQTQTYNISSGVARGTYGKMATPQNIIPNPYKSMDTQRDKTLKKGDPGLQIWVSSTRVDDLVPMAELVSQDKTMIYGSFRIGMKITKVPGTCSAFFWYRSDSEEIDMEFLSSSFNANSNPVYLVMQTPESVAKGYNAAGSNTFDIVELPFQPDEEFHEYRFDWTMTGVSFYADGKWLIDMTWTYPQAPGHLSINHWSNGNMMWTGGPPDQDAVTTVSYVRAYYNTSDESKQASFSAKCPSRDPALVCEITDQTPPPSPADQASDFFFNGGMACGEGPDKVITSTSTAGGTAYVLTSTTSVSTAEQSGPAGSHHSNGIINARPGLCWRELLAMLLAFIL